MYNKKKITLERINMLAENEIFVFCSNLADVHGGAARCQIPCGGRAVRRYVSPHAACGECGMFNFTINDKTKEIDKAFK